MYSLFFPVYKDDKGNEIDILRPIEDYVLPNIKTDVINSDNIASLLAYMINLNFMHGNDVLNGGIETLNAIIASTFLHLSSKFFGIPYDSPNSLERIHNLINSFSYDPLNTPIFGLESFKPMCEEERTMYEKEKSGNFSIHALCAGSLKTDKGIIKLSEDCKWYCQTVVNNRSTHELVRSFYKLTVDLEGPLVADFPTTLLPVCKFPGDVKHVKNACWRRIVSDKGFCFSSEMGV